MKGKEFLYNNFFIIIFNSVFILLFGYICYVYVYVSSAKAANFVRKIDKPL